MNSRYAPSHFQKTMLQTGIRTFELISPITAFGGDGILVSQDKSHGAVVWDAREVRMNSPTSVNIDIYQIKKNDIEEKLLLELTNCGSSIIFSEEGRHFAYFKWLNAPYELQLMVIDLRDLTVWSYPKTYAVANLVKFSNGNITLHNDPVITKITETISLADFVLNK